MASSSSSHFFAIKDTQLKTLLSTYETLFKNNPSHLLNEIPPQEMWRFFIDLERQSIGEKLKKGLKERGVPVEDFQLSPEDFLEKYKEIFPDDMVLVRKTSLNYMKESTKTITAGEVIDMQNGWVSFELTEPGYLMAMISQLRGMMDDPIPLDLPPDAYANRLVQLIKTFHRGATRNVKNLQQEEVETKDERESDNFRHSNDIYCGLLGGEFKDIAINTSFDGYRELLTKMQEKKEDFFHVISLFNPHIDEVGFLVGNKEDMEENGFKYLKKEIEKENIVQEVVVGDLSEEEKKDIYNYHIKGSLDAKQYAMTRNDLGIPCEKNLDKAMMDFAKRYQIAIQKPLLSPIAKLKILVSFIQECELLHPFEDANTRTLSMLLLNQLLIQNGFPPIIHICPLRSRAFSLNEQVGMLIDGMQTTLALARNKTLINEVPTETIVATLSESQRNYFEGVTRVEKTRRLPSLSKDSKKMP